MGSPAMAVRLILVALAFTIALSAAQQSQETGGRTQDRRLNIRRFSARRKAERGEKPQQPRKHAASEEDIAKRRLLFQRNPLRRNRNRPTTDSSSVTEAPIRRPRPNSFVPPPASTDIDPPVVRISNNNRDIQDLVLNNIVEEEEERKPFQGTSVVGTISEPSGFRSLNEQIVRVSFKKTPKDEERPNSALDALLRTANEETEVDKPQQNIIDDSPLSVQQEAALREMQEDERQTTALESRRRPQSPSVGGRQKFSSFPSRSRGLERVRGSSPSRGSPPRRLRTRPRTTQPPPPAPTTTLQEV